MFSASGVEQPVREIAGKAGPGLATLSTDTFRNANLEAAVFRREIDACADAGNGTVDQA